MNRENGRRLSPAVRRWVAGLAIGAAAATVSAVVSPDLPGADPTKPSFFGAAENKSYDLRVAAMAAPVDAASPVVIVAINESSIRALAPVLGRWPWPRIAHASAIDYLASSGAKVIAYDVLFGEREGQVESIVNGQRVSGEDSDRALVASVAKAGNVVLLADATFEGLASESAAAASLAARPPLPGTTYAPGSGFQPRPPIALPFDDLARAAAGVGHNLLVKDAGSDFARRVLPFIDSQGVAVPSLGLAAALAFTGARPDDVKLEGADLRLGAVRIPLLSDPALSSSGAPEPSRQALLRFPKPIDNADHIKTTFPVYSFFDVLLSEDNILSGRPPAIPPSAFAGKLVFVGTTAAGTFDRYATPFPAGAPGVELHATFADNVLSRQFMRRAPFRVDVAIATVAGLAVGLAATLLPVAWAATLAITIGGAALAWVTHEVGQGVWFGAVMPAMAVGLALFGGVAWRYFVEGREKRQIRSMFGRYVSKDVIEQLMSDPARAALGGERRDMTVLFSDIRNFTTATEKGSPEAVVAQLNEYFGEMVAVLFRHGGTLDKFVGDMVMGLFGAPLPDPDHADHAVAAALEMLTALEVLNDKWRAAGLPAVDIGIGINSGEMIAGNIGSEAIMSYTVIGDAVNLGSRLESLNKEYGTHILMSDATRGRLKRPVDARPIGEVTVKGKTQAVMVYELRGLSSSVPESAAKTREP